MTSKCLLCLTVLALPAADRAAAADDIGPTDMVISAERLRDSSSSRSEVTFAETVEAPSRSLLEVTERVSNLQLSAGGAGAFGSLFTYRGLGNTPYFSDPAVTVYLDDLPLAGAFTYPAQSMGFSEAVFARGPQGTAYGRGGSAGVMSFVSAPPGPEPGLQWRVGAGSHAARYLAVSAHTAAGQIDSNPVDASVSAMVSQRDGYIRNRQLQARVDDRESQTLSGRLRWRANASSRYALQWFFDRHADGAQPLVPLGGPLFEVQRGREGQTDIHSTGLAARGEFDLAPGRLSTVTSYTDWRLDPYDNRLVLPPPLDSRIVQRQRTWNEELRLASMSGPGLRWNLGAWFSDSATDGDVVRGIPGLFDIESSRFELTSRTGALFGELEAPLARDWLITAGLRLERVEREFIRVDRLAGAARIDARRSFDAVLPKLAVAHALSPLTTLSATLSLGSKPGGWSAYTGDPALAGFDAEKTRALEVALDWRLPNEALRMNARAFVYDLRDYQIERSFTQLDYLVVNAPRARSSGLELEMDWRASRHLNLSAGVGLTRARLRDFTDVFTGIGYDGSRAPYTPAYDAHVSAAWRTERWFAMAELTAAGKTFFDEAQTPLFAQPARTSANARAGGQFGRVRVTLYGANLTNERYYSLIVPGVFHAVPGAPRSWGLELALQLGG